MHFRLTGIIILNPRKMQQKVLQALALCHACSTSRNSGVCSVQCLEFSWAKGKWAGRSHENPIFSRCPHMALYKGWPCTVGPFSRQEQKWPSWPQMPSEWSHSAMVWEAVPGVLLLILVALFMEEAEDDSGLRPLCKEHSFLKSHVARNRFPSWVTSFVFCLHGGFLLPLAPREKAKENPTWSNQGKRLQAFPLKQM